MERARSLAERWRSLPLRPRPLPTRRRLGRTVGPSASKERWRVGAAEREGKGPQGARAVVARWVEQEEEEGGRRKREKRTK